MKSTALVTFVLLSFCKNYSEAGTIAHRSLDATGYYWRHFDGTIPKDAVEGGVDKAGIVTYIGQVLHDSDVLHPGEIHPLIKNITYSIQQKVYSKNRFIKILCSEETEQLKWISTNVEDFKFLLAEKKIVAAGYLEKAGYPLFVARSVEKPHKIVGRVTFLPEWESIAYPEDNKAVYATKFEVLTFDNYCI